MEAERTIFRMHEQLLRMSKTKLVTRIIMILFAAITTVALIQLIAYHVLYVSQSSLLRHQIEQQFLTGRSDSYKTLPYS